MAKSNSTFLGFEISHRFIIIVLGLATFIHSGLLNGSMNVIVSSLQKEFYLSSRDTGFYISVYDLGAVLCTIILPIVSARGSKPRWIAFGLFTLFIGSMLTVLPHFLRDTDLSFNTDATVEVCNKTVNELDPSIAINTSNIQINTPPALTNFGFIQLRHILYFANIINGFGSASMLSLVFSYIEDIAPHEISATYESIYYVCRALGMGVFFAITSYCLSFYTDFNSQENVLPQWLTTNHPNWIGAWWLPFATFSFVGLFFGIIVFMLPKKIRSSSTKDQAEIAQLTKNKIKQDHLTLENSLVNQLGSMVSFAASRTNLKPKNGLLKQTFILCKNPIYVCLVLSSIIEGLVQNSVLAFASLFFEYQYRFSTGSASLLIGLLALPPLLIGGLLSGWICDKFKNRLKPCLKFIIAVLIVNVVCYAGFMIHCPESKIISPTTGNFGMENVQETNFDKNSTDQICFKTSQNCNCDLKIFKPVCLAGSEDIYFQSPCLAGCTNLNKDSEKTFYSECSQNNCDLYFTGPERQLLKSESVFVEGVCPKSTSCNVRLVLSCITLFVLMMLNAMLFIPYMKCQIAVAQPKNVDPKSDEAKEMNTIALCVNQFFMNVFGTIPGPILYGTVIDMSCSYWHTDSQDHRTCKLYDNESFAFSYGILGMGFKSVCLVCVIISLIIANRKKS